MSVWRQVRAVGPLPGVGVVVVPAVIVLLTGEAGLGWDLPAGLAWLPVAGGLALAGLGLTLMWRTISLFATRGEGTLAPWDATRTLVVLGPYRHVRNPMITGVTLVLLGEAALLGSPGILIWAGVFGAVNAVYMPLVEEPGLARRFGDDYVAYMRNVPRWVPRRTPWSPGAR